MHIRTCTGLYNQRGSTGKRVYPLRRLLIYSHTREGNKFLTRSQIPAAIPGRIIKYDQGYFHSCFLLSLIVGHPTFYANHQVNLLNSDHNNDTFLYNFIFYTCIELILSYYLLEESVTFKILIFSKVFSALI